MDNRQKNIEQRIKRLEAIGRMITQEATMLGKELSDVVSGSSPQKRGELTIGQEAVNRRKKHRFS